jgi:hypothetical protein
MVNSIKVKDNGELVDIVADIPGELAVTIHLYPEEAMQLADNIYEAVALRHGL